MKYIWMVSIAVLVLNVSDVHAATNVVHETSQAFGLKVMLAVLAFLGYMMLRKEQ